MFNLEYSTFGVVLFAIIICLIFLGRKTAQKTENKTKKLTETVEAASKSLPKQASLSISTADIAAMPREKFLSPKQRRYIKIIKKLGLSEEDIKIAHYLCGIGNNRLSLENTALAMCKHPDDIIETYNKIKKAIRQQTA